MEHQTFWKIRSSLYRKQNAQLISYECKSVLKQNKTQVLILMIGNYFLTKEVF